MWGALSSCRSIQPGRIPIVADDELLVYCPVHNLFPHLVRGLDRVPQRGVAIEVSCYEGAVSNWDPCYVVFASSGRNIDICDVYPFASALLYANGESFYVPIGGCTYPAVCDVVANIGDESPPPGYSASGLSALMVEKPLIPGVRDVSVSLVS